jgi:hypothetical protein
MIKDKPITLEQQLIYEAKQRKFKGWLNGENKYYKRHAIEK